jgi:hypothetical protein
VPQSPTRGPGRRRKAKRARRPRKRVPVATVTTRSLRRPVPGTKFAGRCSVGGDERTFNGEAPERYAFEPRDEKLECEVHKEGGGTLGIVCADDKSVRPEQRTGAGEGTMRLVYSVGGIVSSQRSSVTVEQTATSPEGSSSDGPR